MYQFYEWYDIRLHFLGFVAQVFLVRDSFVSQLGIELISMSEIDHNQTKAHLDPNLSL